MLPGAASPLDSSKKSIQLEKLFYLENMDDDDDEYYQRWSRGHKAQGQGQGHKKIRGQGQPFRGQTLSRPRTGMLEAKDQGHKRKCFPKKKRSSQNFFRQSPKKKVFTKIFQAISTKKRFPKYFSSAPQNFINSKNSAVLKPRPRPRTSKCVLEAKDVLEDSTSEYYLLKCFSPT